MAGKKGTSKISSVKRSNKLRTKLQKQGKLKARRNRDRQKKICKTGLPKYYQNVEEQDNSENENEALDMIENEDLLFLQNAVANQSYSFLKDIDSQGENFKTKRSKKKGKDSELETHELQYEQMVHNSESVKKKKYLLPIKTSKGIVIQSEELNDSENEDIENNTKNLLGTKKKTNFNLAQEFDKFDEVRSADLVAFRENALAKYKFRIGILCSELTETPEQKIHNFKPLINMFHEGNFVVCLTLRKLVLVSLLEVFKDLLPEYQIKQHDDPNVKLKKTVKQLHSFEETLLKYYKAYLKEIEKIVKVLKKRKGDNRILKEAHIKLAETGLKCLCELLIAHPYFNFSKNIIHLLVPFLNSGRENIREMISACIRGVFKADKRGNVSLDIVRNINKFVKSKKNIAHSEVLLVFLSLNLKDVNLDKEKEEEIRKKKDEAKKYKLLQLSKREKKRIKKFQSLKKDLLETKAEENKKSKEECMTEITKTIFTIYFRILKETASSKLLNAALEGLAKFAHCINVEFYQDLIIVLDKITQSENLGYKEILCCVRTVFTVLHYQGATIYIDPVRFYSHFYANILQINAGVNHSDLPVIIKTTDFVLLKRRKHLSLQRLLAFTKRLISLSLQVLPNGTLALLSLIKDILQVNNSTDVLLDFEAVHGQGVYYPEMEEPEYCNASATSLWELLPLEKHYHPTVREFAKYLTKSKANLEEIPQGKTFLKQSAEQLFEQFDANNVRFNPAIPAPRKFARSKRKRQNLLHASLESYVETTLKKAKLLCSDFFDSN